MLHSAHFPSCGHASATGAPGTVDVEALVIAPDGLATFVSTSATDDFGEELQAVAMTTHARVAARGTLICAYWLALIAIGTTVFPQCIASTAESPSTIGK